MKTLIILHGWQSSQERWGNVKNAIEKEGIEVKKINGEQTVADVHKDILKVIKQL